jgi:DNA-binding GntR family transcriptional regulator
MLERRALRLDVRDALTQAITQGHLQPGDRIVESRVARDLGVSQTTVREALRDLESTGLIVYTTNRGCEVRRLSPAEVAEVYDMRALLEGDAARRAAVWLTSDDLASLDQLVDEMVRLADAGETTQMIDADVRFHQLIVEAAHHTMLQRLWSTMNPALWTHLAVIGILGVPPTTIAHRHRAVVDALRSGDPARAQSALTQHLLELRDLAEEKLSGGAGTND